MTIHEIINNFLRDGQYRIAQLSVAIDKLGDEGSYQYDDLFEKRLKISVFMDILYEGQWPITDGYNHVQVTNWSERELQQEIEHIRYYTGMNEVPYINFTAHYPKINSEIVENTGGETPGNAEFPEGEEGQFLRYNASGQVYAETISEYGGYNDETITNYFLGRE